jgi:hypothetical protein
VTPDFVWDMPNFAGWTEQPIYAGAEGPARFLDVRERRLCSIYPDWEPTNSSLRSTARLNDEHAAVQLIERLEWAVTDELRQTTVRGRRTAPPLAESALTRSFD